MRIGLQGAFGRSQITIDDSATVGELQAKIAEASSLAAFDLKGGFPPRPIDLSQFDTSTKLSDTGLKLNGERIQVEAKNAGGQKQGTLSGATQSATTAPSVPTSNAPAKQPAATTPSTQPNFTNPSRSTRSTQSSQPKASNLMNFEPSKPKLDAPELPIRNGDSFLVHRVMPDDNSCLFRAIGKCVLGDTVDGTTELRSMVAQAIQADPERYNEAVLEMKPDDYCKWIQNPDHWGGAVEIQIIAESFGIEVYAMNIKDNSIQKFNEGQGMRSFLVYSGIHWDLIVENMMGMNGPGEIDVAQFEAWDDEVLQNAKEIGKELGKAGYYTDTNSLGIKCKDCGWTGKGEQEALQHGQSMGHGNFEQIS